MITKQVEGVYLATIREIARVAGVSPSTVSRVLNHDRSLQVQDVTRDRILSTAHALGYKVRKKPTDKQKSNSNASIKLGIVLFMSERQELDRPYYQSLRQGVEIECEARNLQITNTIRLVEGTSVLPAFEGLDGLIVLGNYRQANVYTSVHDLPIVFVDTSPDIHRFDSVLTDLEEATSQALNHLLEIGHSNIAYIGSRPIHHVDPRLQVYRQMMRERELYRETNEFLTTDSFPMDGYDTMKVALSAGERPSAIFVMSDPLAFGVMAALHQQGMRVPDDISIISFGDVELAAFSQPPMTTVRAYPELMGKMAVKLVIERLDGRTVPVKVVFPTTLIVRGTTSPL